METGYGRLLPVSDDCLNSNLQLHLDHYDELDSCQPYDKIDESIFSISTTSSLYGQFLSTVHEKTCSFP